MSKIRNLCDWPFSRIALLWIVGMTFQILLVAVPSALQSSRGERSASRVGSLQANARAPRPKKGMEKLVPSKRAAYVTSAGDSIFQMVLPADSAGVRSVPKGPGYYLFVFAILGVIPVGLLIVTSVWSFAQLMKKFMPDVLAPESPPTATQI